MRTAKEWGELWVSGGMGKYGPSVKQMEELLADLAVLEAERDDLRIDVQGLLEWRKRASPSAPSEGVGYPVELRCAELEEKLKALDVYLRHHDTCLNASVPAERLLACPFCGVTPTLGVLNRDDGFSPKDGGDVVHHGDDECPADGFHSLEVWNRRAEAREGGKPPKSWDDDPVMGPAIRKAYPEDATRPAPAAIPEGPGL